MPFGAIVVLLGILLTAFGVLVPGFFTAGHLLEVSQTAALLGIVSVGQTLAVLTGGIDLSVAAIMVLTNVLGGEWMHGEMTLLPALYCLAVGLAIGLGNGLGIALGRLPPMVMTLASTVIVTGYTYIHTGGLVRGSASPGLKAIAGGTMLGVPNLTVIWLMIAVIAIVMARGTVVGRQIYAVGSNPAGARAAGVEVRRIVVLVYAISGMLAGVAGFLLVGYLGNPISGFAGQAGYTLESVGAVVLGGTVFSGARGGVERTVIGVLVLRVLFSGLVMLQVGSAGRLVLTGLLLIVIVAAHERLQRWRPRPAQI